VNDSENDIRQAGYRTGWRVLTIAGGSCFLVLQAIFLFQLASVSPGENDKPDILLVTIDTLRADHCSLYGYGRATTPTMDRLAAQGVRFDNAYAPMATTAPSHATILTSLHPLAHGVIRNGFVLADEYETLAEMLKREGYVTAAFVSSFVLFNRFGCGQGYDEYDDDFTESESTQQGADQWQGVAVPGGKVDRRADATTGRALKWLESIRATDNGQRRPVFMWVHYMDPHEPYVPPEALGDPFGACAMTPAGISRVIAQYDGEIAFTDAQLERLVDQFEARGGDAGALIVVTADHGEAFVEHGWRGHGPQIYEESVRVPLVIRWEGVIRAPKTVNSPVGLHDIVPTILGLIDATPSEGWFEGVDFSGAILQTTSPDSRRPMFFQRRLYDEPGTVKPIPLREFEGATFGRGIRVRGHKFGVRVGRWKYLEALEEDIPRELYDLRADPAEQLNVAADHPDRVKSMSRLIAQWRQRQATLFRADRIQEISPQDRAVLNALGYVDAEDGDANGKDALP